MTLRPRLVFFSLVTVMVIIAILFGGTTMTAYASQSALPGDPLYQVKTSMEKTQVIFSFNAASRAELDLELAQRRLDEISALIAEKRFNDIRMASAEFESYIGQSLAELNTISIKDPARASQLGGQVSAALFRYGQALSGMLVDVPPTVKPEIERSVILLQTVGSQPIGASNYEEFEGLVEAISPASWTISGKVVLIPAGMVVDPKIKVGDKVEVKATKATDGTLTAVSIKLENDDKEDNNQDENSNSQHDQDEDRENSQVSPGDSHENGSGSQDSEHENGGDQENGDHERGGGGGGEGGDD